MLVALPALVLSPSASAETAAVAAIADVGRVPITEPGTHPTDGQLLINPVSRRGYLLFSPPGNPPGTVVQSFDLDTFEYKRRIVIPNFSVLRAGNPNGPGDVVSAVDGEGKQVFLAGTVNPDIDLTFGLRREVRVAQLDETAFEATGAAPTRLPIPTDQAALLAEQRPFGMAYTGPARTGSLLLLFSQAVFAPVDNTRPRLDHYLVKWDAANGGGQWLQRLDVCERAPLIDPLADAAFQLPILVGQDAIHLACQTGGGVAQAVTVALDSSGRPTTQRGFPLPRQYKDVLVDPVAERLQFMVELGGITWWTFDGKAGAYVGSAGATQYTGYPIGGGIDPATGRLYSLVPDHAILANPSSIPVKGGLAISDTRLTPAPQLFNVRPDLAYPGQFKMAVDPAAAGRPTRVFVRPGSSYGVATDYPDTTPKNKPPESYYLVLEDRIPITPQPSFGEVDRNTVDADLEEDVTDANFDATGSAYGARVLLIGGTNAATSRDLDNNTAGCFQNDRELVLGLVESSRLSNLQASATATALKADESTKADLQNPTSRCIDKLGVQVPPETTALADSLVGQKWDSDGDKKDDYTAECAGDDPPANAPGPAKLGQDYAASAECGQAARRVKASARSAFQVAGPLTVRVAHGESSTEIGPSEDDRGMKVVSRATADGIEILGVGSGTITIGSVTSTAVAESNGRPNGAKTEFRRTICRVEMPGFSQTSCLTPAEQQDFVARLNQLFAGRGEARLRTPDAELAAGSPGGYLGAVQRDRREAFSDSIITRDRSAAVPGLELISYRGDSPTKGAGRQVVQLAATQASSAFGVFCLRGADASGACNEPPKPDPANLKISLSDDSTPANPLAGGLFKVYSDDDGDGVLGEADKLVDGGSCLTTADGVGNCEFNGLEPGNYVIEQTKAPVGYQPTDPFAVELTSGNTRTVQFTNLLAVGVISMRLTDDSADRKPLKGGAFEVYADDGDEKKGDGDLRYASCTTDDSGNCRMALEPAAESVAPPGEEPVICLEASGICLLAVPLGPYVVHEAAAPDGYDPAKDVGFSLNQPGDLALLSFANGLKAAPGTAGTQAVPGGETMTAEPELEPEPEALSTEATADTPGTAAVPPTETVVIESVAAAPQPIVSTTPTKSGGGVAREVLRLPAKFIEKGVQGLKLLFSSPRELGLMAAVWLLVWAPCYLGERRRLAVRLTLTSTGVSS